ncbi:hypothetical protein KIP88_44515 [Bradyrhizobium sp. SRL28]|uniref:hypothetical protein n=1 Tax=Bradyrhizobium sp. SRL28 TaxID=2836178 RepID=UPI001BDF6997|nr:hypothetical protein [Bradyrhizobium sp. SRL28]MBT1517375.1 hypothetical protein [Bradyrhizobium sp. SRL28]
MKADDTCTLKSLRALAGVATPAVMRAQPKEFDDLPLNVNADRSNFYSLSNERVAKPLRKRTGFGQ